LPGTFPLLDQHGKPVETTVNPKLSWRVEILPFIGEDDLYKQFNLAEPWDSPHNKQLIPRMPKMYSHPAADPTWARDGLTVYRVVTGSHSAFRPGAARPTFLTDGRNWPSNTIMIAESADPVIWTKPDEMEYEPDKPLPKLREYFRGRYLLVTFDGKVHTTPTSISEKTLRSAMTIDDDGHQWDNYDR
jgi:hypothetical protein